MGTVTDAVCFHMALSLSCSRASVRPDVLMWALTQQAERKCTGTDQGTGAQWGRVGEERLLTTVGARGTGLLYIRTTGTSKVAILRTVCNGQEGLQVPCGADIGEAGRPCRVAEGLGTAHLTAAVSLGGVRLSAPGGGRPAQQDLDPAGPGPEPSPLGRMTSDSSPEPFRLRFSPENRG